MKIRKIFFLLIQIVALQIYAQSELILPKMKIYKFAEMVNSEIDVYENRKLHLFFKLDDNEELRQVNKSKSLAEHVTYKHFINDKEVLFSTVKVHRAADKSVIIQSFLVTSEIIIFDDALPYLLPTSKGLVSVKKLNALGWLPSFDLLDGFTRSIHYQIEKNKEYV